MIRIHVDRSRCAGHALCYFNAPEVYQVDEEGYCSSDGLLVGPELAEQARQGACHCPEGVITLTEEP